MEREILFRGKRVDNGEWAYGFYCEAEMFGHAGTEYFIIEYSCDGSQYRVEPATVGQYTGLTDKHDVKIFEGDIMGFDSYGSHCQGIVTVIGGNFCILCGKVAGPYVDRALECLKATLIGNVHDNPEFLEVM